MKGFLPFTDFSDGVQPHARQVNVGNLLVVRHGTLQLGIKRHYARLYYEKQNGCD